MFSRSLSPTRTTNGIGIVILFAGLGPTWAELSPPTGAGQVHTLPPSAAGRDVTVRGIVTYSNPALAQFYLQEESGGVLVRHVSSLPTPAPGQNVEAIGRVLSVAGHGIVDRAELKFLGAGTLPVAPPLLPMEIRQGRGTGRLVTVRGVAQRVYTNEFGRFSFDLFVDREPLHVWFREPGIEIDPDQYIGATVDIRGVFHPFEEGKFLLLAQSPTADQVRIVDPPPVIDAVPVRDLAARVGQRIRVEGRVGAGPQPQTYTLTDPSGSVVVYPVDPVPRLEVGERAEAMGFVRDGSLHAAVVRALVSDPARAGAVRQVLHSTREVRRLSTEAAENGQSVRLRGVVTHAGHAYHDFFLQDSVGAVYVDAEHQPNVPAPGAFIELVGVTGKGSFTNEILQPRWTLLAQARAPVPETVTPPDLITGRLDARWVVIEGVIQSARSDQNHLFLKLMTRMGGIDYRLPGSDGRGAGLVGAQVRAQGVYVAIHNNDRRAYGFRLLSPSSSHLEVLQAAPLDPFAGPTVPIGRLLTFNPDLENGSRLSVAGVVTAVLDDGAMYIQVGDDGVLVRPVQPWDGASGDGVRVAGFVEKEGPTVVLADALVRAQDREHLPVARHITSADVRAVPLDGRLVRITGELQEVVGSDGSVVLQMSDGQTQFSAVLPRVTGAHLPPIDPLSQLSLVGALQVRGEGAIGKKEARIQSFRIVLRSASDVTVVKRPPWWTVGRFQSVAIGAAGLLGLSLLGLVVLRLRIRHQTGLIREAFRKEAQLEARFRQLVEGANDVIFRLDAAGRVLDWNPAGERLLGRTREDVLGRALTDFTNPEQAPAVTGLLGDGPSTRELALRAANGRSITLEVTTRKIPAEDGGGVEAIARDITERRQLEEQLRQAGKMKAIGHLAGGVAHDFNNLLTVINGNCDLVIRETEPGDPRRALLDEVRTAGLKAAGVTRQLLAFGRQTVLAPTVLDLNELLCGLRPVLTRLLGEKVTLRFDLATQLRPVRADGPSLEQVVLNLVVNARDAMPNGGVVSIATGVDEDWVRLQVADSGVGMDSQTQARLFEPYFTTKGQGKGTGLGLAVVLGVVDQTGGRIEVETAPGEGATFTIEFPAATGQSYPGVDSIAPSQIVEAPWQAVVLLVEDEPAVQLLERRVLENAGYRVLVASSGEEALLLLDRHADRLDLLMTDVVMPGMSGRELAEAVARRRPDLPVLFLSGYTPDEVLRQGVEASAAHFLQKPFTPGGLLKKVREVLAQPPA